MYKVNLNILGGFLIEDYDVYLPAIPQIGWKIKVEGYECEVIKVQLCIFNTNKSCQDVICAYINLLKTK